MYKCVSIIVPVYNVENYVDACVESILTQTYSNLEIILIDDGSTDGSGKRCDQWAEKDNRIRVLHQKNGGLSAARNAGLDICTGEWIVFIDSDDVLPENAIKTLSDLVITQKAEIGQGVSTVMGNKAQAAENFTKVFSGIEFLKSDFYSTSACGKIYHKKVWENRRFQEGIIHEDYDIMYQIIYEALCVNYSNQVVYWVRERTNSITRGGFSEDRLVLLDIDEKKIAYFRERKEEFLLEQAYKSYYSNLLHLYKQCKKKDIMRKYRKNFIHFIAIGTIGARTKLKLAVCYFFPSAWERRKIEK